MSTLRDSPARSDLPRTWAALRLWSVLAIRAGWEVPIVQVDSPPHTVLEARALEGVCPLFPRRLWATADQPRCILRRQWVTRILSRCCWTTARIPMHGISTRYDQLTRRERRVRARSCAYSKNSKPIGTCTLQHHHGTLSWCPTSPRMYLVRRPHCLASPCQHTPPAAHHPLDVTRRHSDDLRSLRFMNPLLQPQFTP